MDVAVKAAYSPRLNREHSAWCWFDVADLRALIGLEGPDAQRRALASRNGTGVDLHPVVVVLLGNESLP